MTSIPRGKAVIGQSGGPTAVINQSLVGAIEEAAKHDAITAIYGARHGIHGILEQNFVDLGSQSRERLEVLARTPSAGLGSVRMKPDRDHCERLFKILRAHDVRYFFYIGGNDSAETANIIDELAQESGYDFRVAHIPKTIDNDLLVTDHCPGFGSAARFVALALMGDNLDNRALAGVKINVIMGRSAGFLTAAAALGRQREDDGPHLIYVPEVKFSLDRFCGDVEACLQKYGRCVIAVSEGIEDEAGNPIGSTGDLDSHGNPQLSGSGALGDKLAGTIRRRLGVERVRADTFGYLQRSFPGSISDVDAREARAVGAEAVKAVLSGEVSSTSVAMRRLAGGAYDVEYFLTELSSVARRTRSLAPEFLSSSGNDISRAFIDYALPLTGGLPEIGSLDDFAVAKIDL